MSLSFCTVVWSLRTRTSEFSFGRFIVRLSAFALTPGRLNRHSGVFLGRSLKRFLTVTTPAGRRLSAPSLRWLFVMTRIGVISSSTYTVTSNTIWSLVAVCVCSRRYVLVVFIISVAARHVVSITRIR